MDYIDLEISLHRRDADRYAVELRYSDPESDAADEIWFLWDEFVAKSEALKAAADAGMGVDSPEALGAALQGLNGSCKDCHSQFKL